MPNLDLMILDMLADADKVVVRLLWQSRTDDGHQHTRETIDILRFANGQAVEHWGAVARA